MEDRFKFRAYFPTGHVGRTEPHWREWSVEDEEHYLAWAPDRIIMQCTGTTDRNGKLIYEGDIVVQEYLESIYIIQFCGTCFMAVLHTKAPQMDCLIEGSTYEVIGNIWENKELLEAHDK